MKKSSFLAGVTLLFASLFTTSCKEMMSNLDEPVSSYLAAPADITVPTGDTYDLTGFVTSINSDKRITYKSSDEKVATVDANGVVTGIADGEATITVSVAASEYYKEGTKDIKVAVKRPLTFEALVDGTISVWFHGAVLEKPVVYTKNGGAKQEITTDTSIDVVKGDKVEFESANERLTSSDWNWGVQIHPHQSAAVYGNVMSMITPDGNYHINKTITKDFALYGLLCGSYVWDDTAQKYIFNTVAHDKYKLLLPATTLTTACYARMLQETGFTEAPELPATELANYCYQNMFQECHNLTKAPELKATKLTDGCYGSMFWYCSGLTEAPVLPATTLAPWCYQNMFTSCSKLEKAPALPATKLENGCYSDMFAGCTSLKKAPALPATTLADYCYNYMFGGCSALTEAPELKAETLADNCYNSMFSGCSKLNKVVCLATTNATDALGYWLNGAGTDASVTKRTLVRAESNKKWTNNDVWTWGTANWYVPTGWTIEPEFFKSIVLVPGVWDLDNARFAAYVWKSSPSSEEHWYLFSKENDKWTATIPSTYTGLVLVRLNNGTEVNWDSKWNQTSDIDFTNVADNSTISITGWGTDDYTITVP